MARDPLAHPDEMIRRVYAYVAYRVGPGSDAEDITSETMVRAVRYRDAYDPKKGKPVTWAIGIARGCIADHYAANTAIPTEPNEHLATHEDVATNAAERLTVAAAVSRLDQRDRELVALRYGADLSTRQIAELLELTPNAVDVALHRARTQLRSELDSAGPAVPSHGPLRPSAELTT